jgi:AraC-like DNA-binding protein
MDAPHELGDLHDRDNGGRDGPLIGVASPRANIPRIGFTTRGLGASAQFDAYREYCSPVLDIVPPEGPRAPFSATCDMWMLDRLVFRRIRVPSGRFARSAKQIRRDGLDHWVFNVALRGKSETRTPTGTLTAGADVLSVFSLGGAYEARRTDIDWLGLFVPRGAFPAIDSVFNHHEQVAVDNAPGRLLMAYLIALAAELPSLTEPDLAPVIAATHALVAACAVPTSVMQNSDIPHLETWRLHKVRDVIEQNLGSWRFNTGALCKLAGVSRSSLYRMFEPYGGVARYIQQQRLRRAHDLLADPDCAQTITSIAYDFCFSDPSSFSRAFRAEYGYSPRDLRVLAGSGRLVPAVSQSRHSPSKIGSWEMLHRV